VLASGSDSVPFTTIGGLNDTFPQGRKVTQWQINDNLTWTRGRHTLHFGVNTRRVDTSDYDLGEGTVPTVDLQRPGGVHLRSRIHCQPELPRLPQGKSGVRQSRILRDGHLQAVREGHHHLRHARTWNTNVTSPQGLFSRMAGSFPGCLACNQQPLNRGHSKPRTQPVRGHTAVRLSAARLVAYELLARTALHAGFGVFNDIIPQQIADSGLMNAPNDPSLHRRHRRDRWAALA
jgi:hypothetical protein